MSVRCIVVGVDESDGTRTAIEWAGELASDLSARVVAVHVFDPLQQIEERPGGGDLSSLRDRAAQQLDTLWSAPLHDLGVDVETVVVEGLPAQAILDAAQREGADLIVLGARRQSLLRAAALGSTSSRVARDSAIPVTIVHTDG